MSLERCPRQALYAGSAGEAPTRRPNVVSGWVGRRQACASPLDQVTVVCDNAPVHCDLEAVVANFPGVELVRTAPYNTPLNPIETVWSSMKVDMKRDMAHSFAAMLDTAEA